MSTTQDGYTPLMTAAFYGKCDVVIELLDNGADVNAQNDVSVIVYMTFIHLNSSYFWNTLEPKKNVIQICDVIVSVQCVSYYMHVSHHRLETLH